MLVFLFHYSVSLTTSQVQPQALRLLLTCPPYSLHTTLLVHARNHDFFMRSLSVQLGLGHDHTSRYVHILYSNPHCLLGSNEELWAGRRRGNRRSISWLHSATQQQAITFPLGLLIYSKAVCAAQLLAFLATLALHCTQPE